MIIYECTVPDDWLKSVTDNLYKGKGDATERSNKGIKQFRLDIESFG